MINVLVFVLFPYLLWDQYSFGLLIRETDIVELEFDDVGFLGENLTREPGEYSSEQNQEPATNSTHVWRQLRNRTRSAYLLASHAVVFRGLVLLLLHYEFVKKY